MKVYQAPEPMTSFYPKSLFLAGSIEMGKAEQWQAKVIDMLKDSNYNILNPRRDDWDSSWEQNIENEQFKEQVEWELNYLKRADFVLFYFSPNTNSPITLLELGLMAGQYPKKCIVICPEGFYRKGNVDIVCKYFGIRQIDTLEDAVAMIPRI